MAGRSSRNEETVNHYGAVRLRAVGSAALKLILYSLDEVKQFHAKDLTIKSKNNIELNRLTNFTQQRAKLEIRTTEINEVLQINKVIIFVKPVAKSYPEGA